MEPLSVFNDILGPVMRGPSSSHTAGSYHLGRLVASLLDARPARASFTFDPDGSYAQTYSEQGVDLAFAAGLLGWDLTDERFPRALEIAALEGLDLSFQVAPLAVADHPNTVLIDLADADGRSLSITARSTGGGGVEITRIDDLPISLPVSLHGKAHEVVVRCAADSVGEVERLLGPEGTLVAPPDRTRLGDEVVLTLRRREPLPPEVRARARSLPDVRRVLTAAPVFLVPRGQPLFESGEAMVRLAEERSCSLGQLAAASESAVLGVSDDAVLAEMARRLALMRAAVTRGLAGDDIRMRLLRPTARSVFEAESRRGLAVGGVHARAAARALAVMHVANSRGIVVAAPTGGSAGVIPGVVLTLAEDLGLSEEGTLLALFAASAVGIVIARRATFAAEVAGCQVEIGAAGAMAAAAVVEVAGGDARQAADAAAISLQNTMGSVCDLVQGTCEIPCHTRNAVAASSAFVCADLVLGGFENPVPLDETVDAVYASGRMLPAALRCTGLGGLAVAPSALRLPRHRGD